MKNIIFYKNDRAPHIISTLHNFPKYLSNKALFQTSFYMEFFCLKMSFLERFHWKRDWRALCFASFPTLEIDSHRILFCVFFWVISFYLCQASCKLDFLCWHIKMGTIFTLHSGQFVSAIYDDINSG